MALPAWNERVPEESRLFNPAFCGCLLYEFVKAYDKARSHPPSYAIAFCALPISLHSNTRALLPYSTVTSMLGWLEENPTARVGFASRARHLAPYVREALIYSISRQALEIDEQGRLALGPKKSSFTPGFLDGTSTEVRDIVSATRKVGRWFAAAGGTSTIMTAWGVRP